MTERAHTLIRGRLEVFGRRFYVGFKGRIGADPMHGENSNEVDFEYQLSKRSSINGRYGDARAGGAGVSGRKDY